MEYNTAAHLSLIPLLPMVMQTMQSRCPKHCVNTYPLDCAVPHSLFLLSSNTGISEGASNDELVLSNNNMRNSLVLSTILSQDISAEEAQG